MKQTFWIFLSVFTPYFAKATKCDYKTKIEFSNPHIFAPMKGSNATGGFAKIKNSCAEEVEVVLKAAAGFKAVESHVTIEENGRMAMKKTESFKIKPGETIELVPGGKHLMFFDPQLTLKQDDYVDLTFSINKEDITVRFKIVPRMPNIKKSHH